MDPSSITPSGVYVYSYVTNASIPVAYTFSSDLMAVTMTRQPRCLLTSSITTLAAGLSTAFTGNAQSSYYWWSSDDLFYTGNGPSSVRADATLRQPAQRNDQRAAEQQQRSVGRHRPRPSLQRAGRGRLAEQHHPHSGRRKPDPLTAYPENGDTIVALQLPYVLQPNTAYTLNVTGVTD